MLGINNFINEWLNMEVFKTNHWLIKYLTNMLDLLSFSLTSNIL